jgi:hypothetical protein
MSDKPDNGAQEWVDAYIKENKLESRIKAYSVIDDSEYMKERPAIFNKLRKQSAQEEDEVMPDKKKKKKSSISFSSISQPLISVVLGLVGLGITAKMRRLI